MGCVNWCVCVWESTYMGVCLEVRMQVCLQVYVCNCPLVIFDFYLMNVCFPCNREHVSCNEEKQSRMHVLIAHGGN